MRILMVSNLYPPYYRGGYEVRCAQVAEALCKAGHEVRVLTSAYGLPMDPLGRIPLRTEERRGVPVHRWLNQYSFAPQPRHRPWTLFRAWRELRDARRFLRVLREFQPDVVNWWSLYGMAKTLMPVPERQGIPDVHWVEHWWMIEEYARAGGATARFWDRFLEGRWGPGWAQPLLRRFGRRWERRMIREGLTGRSIPLRPTHVCFVSEFMRSLHRQAGLDFPSSEVIHGGVPIGPFLADPREGVDGAAPLRLLYAGQITRDRGLETVIEALGALPPEVRGRLVLRVAGDGPKATEEHMQGRVAALGLTDVISFLGRVPHDQMATVYRAHDVLVFASVRAEGLPLTMVEAMLSGCAVVTTGSGGAMEIALPAHLPLFAGGDSEGLAELLTRLVRNPAEVRAIARRGQDVAVREFSFERMMERFTATLERLCRDGATVAGRPDDRVRAR